MSKLIELNQKEVNTISGGGFRHQDEWKKIKAHHDCFCYDKSTDTWVKKGSVVGSEKVSDVCPKQCEEYDDWKTSVFLEISQ